VDRPVKYPDQGLKKSGARAGLPSPPAPHMSAMRPRNADPPDCPPAGRAVAGVPRRPHTDMEQAACLPSRGCAACALGRSREATRTEMEIRFLREGNLIGEQSA